MELGHVNNPDIAMVAVPAFALRVGMGGFQISSAGQPMKIKYNMFRPTVLEREEIYYGARA
jgi:hypothetical protein